MVSAEDARISETRFRALATALRGERVEAIRCPECEVQYLEEPWPGVWNCDRCGRVENPRSDGESSCPYCGRPGLALCWEEEIVECSHCGVVDKEDLRAIVCR